MKPTPSRRALIVAAPLLALGSHRVFAASSQTYSTRTIDLMRRSTVIDMLAPLTMNATVPMWDQPLPAARAADFRRSGVTAFHNSPGYRSLTAHQDMLAWFARWNGFVARNPDLFVLVDRAADIDRAKAAGKMAIIQGLQNSDHFRTAADVELFADLGQRVSQLTYNWQNLIGSGSTERVDGGVSDFGAEIIAAMEKNRMLVDVSHCGDRTTLDAIALAKGPVAITHSNARALNNHPRLKTDEAIKALAAKGGVFGVTGVRMFVRDKEPTTIEHLVDHIDYVAKLVGVEHVGIGSDSDLWGYDALPAAQYAALKAQAKASYAVRDKGDIEAFGHPQKMFDLTEALIRRGWSDAHIQAVLGGNFRRLLGQVWA